MFSEYEHGVAQGVLDMVKYLYPKATAKQLKIQYKWYLSQLGMDIDWSGYMLGESDEIIN